MEKVDELIGTCIDDRYEVVKRIGAGGMADVYRARQLSVDRDVAIKVLAGDAARDADLIRRFQVEARIISRLRHPNTLKLIDFGSLPDGRMFLVSEMLEGAPLDVVLKTGPLSVERTLHLLRQAFEALAEAHSAGVVHRDLKPGNLFVEEVEGQEVLKVLDFGIARVLHGTAHTVTGKIFGTPSYMSPEQARGETVDAATDLYSMGVVAYHCLAGAQPFTGTTPYSVLLKPVNDPPPPLDVSVAPAALRGLVMSLLAKTPSDRPASAREVAERLRSLERGQAVTADLSTGNGDPSTHPSQQAPDPDATRTQGIDPASSASDEAQPPPLPGVGRWWLSARPRSWRSRRSWWSRSGRRAANPRRYPTQRPASLRSRRPTPRPLFWTQRQDPSTQPRPPRNPTSRNPRRLGARVVLARSPARRRSKCGSCPGVRCTTSATWPDSRRASSTGRDGPSSAA